jgi:glycosyltransferase involved in cell wall biosynthesis
MEWLMDQYNFNKDISHKLFLRKPSIALVVPCLGGGGAERVTLTLACEFAARGLAVDLVLMERTGQLLEQVPDSVRVVDLRIKKIRQLPFAFKDYLRDRQPDYAIANMWPLTIACVAGHRLARSPALLAVCDHAALSVQYASWGRLHSVLLRRSIAAFYPRAGIRLTVSAGVADDLSEIAGLDRTSIVPIHNPVVVHPDVPGEQAAVDAAWNGWRGKRIMNVGNLKKQKNHALLIRAFALLPDNARLMILGEGELLHGLRALAQELGVADRVLLPGFVLDPAPFYRSADLFVLSSDYEGFANVIAEAMTCGLSVVSTDCPAGPAEILENGRYGTLVPVGNAVALAGAMRQALAAPSDPDRLRARARDFAPARIADRYLEVLGINPRAGLSPPVAGSSMVPSARLSRE